jgi:aminoglycoside phosphotransferase (APT) family kinase protein
MTPLRDQLGDELCALLHRRPAVREVEALVGIDYPGRVPRAFRVGYADGLVVKAVRASSVAQAALVERLSRRLDPAAFAPVLARSGDALLMRWIDGVPLHECGWTALDAQQGGRLLADLHAIPVSDDAAVPASVGVEAYTAKLAAHLDRIVAHQALGSGERQALLDLARAHLPPAATVAVIHCDLCPENLVRQPSGALCVVDIETLTIGACDYDLARAWYRWPMTPDQRTAFLAAYGAQRGANPCLRHFPYWAICATAASAARRMANAREGAAVPLQRLRALRRDLQAGVDGRFLATQR